MDKFQLDNYLYIDDMIASLEDKKAQIRTVIYQKNLATHVAYDELGMYTTAPRIENIVSDNIEACELIDKRIKRWKLRRWYFSSYLAKLSQKQQESLKKGIYSKSLYNETMDEIQQIEIAVAFHDDYHTALDEPEEENNLMSMINTMSEVYVL